jgi:hypothetical protein
VVCAGGVAVAVLISATNALLRPPGRWGDRDRHRRTGYCGCLYGSSRCVAMPLRQETRALGATGRAVGAARGPLFGCGPRPSARQVGGSGPRPVRPETSRLVAGGTASGPGLEQLVRNRASQARVSWLRADHAPRFPGKRRIPATCPRSTASPPQRTPRSVQVRWAPEEAHRPSRHDPTLARRMVLTAAMGISPGGGHGKSPLMARISPHGRPSFLPTVLS